MSRFYGKITAKFDSECEVCGKALHTGDTIAWKRLGRRSYVRCLDCMGWTPYTKESPKELFIAQQKQDAWDRVQRFWHRKTDHQKNDHELREANV